MARPDLAVDLAPEHLSGLKLRNPVLIASGTFGQDGYGGGLPPGLDVTRLGAIVAKTTTVRPRLGNDRPRFAHGRGWTLNSIGLANPGIEAVLREHAPRWVQWSVPVVLSLAGERVEEYRELAAAVEGTPGVSAVEVNVSCPNVEGGLEFGQSPELTGAVVRAVRSATGLPVLVKLSPNVASIEEVALAAVRGGAHALTLTNTLVGMALDPKTRSSVLGTATGGVSGPALKPVVLAMVYRVFRAVEVPIVGVGGIGAAEDALDYLAAGALAVQVGVANFANPRTPLDVLDGLERHASRRGLTTVGEMVGAAHRGPPSAQAATGPAG
jgi:dihydroorotate dehydrogenase (NAD+) catalytic subunit